MALTVDKQCRGPPDTGGDGRVGTRSEGTRKETEAESGRFHGPGRRQDEEDADGVGGPEEAPREHGQEISAVRVYYAWAFFTAKGQLFER